MPPTPYYEDEHVTLYCGRCEDVLPTLPRGQLDMLIADPPYGMELEAGRKRKRADRTIIAGDHLGADVTDALVQAIKVIRNHTHIYVFQRGGVATGNVCWKSWM